MDFDFFEGSEKIEYKDFELFLSDVEKDFIPPLYSRIDPASYFAKLKKHAFFVVCKIDSNIVGLVASYDNNLETRLGFISLIAVKKEFRGLNIASEMLAKCCSHAKKMGMSVIGIETDNLIAKNCYLKNGFILKETTFIQSLGIEHFYLEKKL